MPLTPAQKDDAARLAPLLAVLGLDSVPDDPAAIQRAYRLALRKRPADTSLRNAAHQLQVEMRRGSRSGAPAVLTPPLALTGPTFSIASEAKPSQAGVPACGCASAQGLRPSMEDEMLVGIKPELGEQASDVSLFAIFDGHGGPRAAKMLARQLPNALQLAASACRAAGSRDQHGPILSASAARVAFADMDERIRVRSAAGHWDDGSCACVALLDTSRRVLQLMQVGDCNGLLLRRGSSDKAGALVIAGDDESSNVHQRSEPPAGIGRSIFRPAASAPPPRSPLLCPNHRPTEPAEFERLRAVGAKVSATGRCAGLAVSRVFGDHALKQSQPSGALLAEPELVLRSLESADELLLLACDGLWDFVTAEQACATVNLALAPTNTHAARDLAAASKALVQEALDRGGTDNVSVLLVDLRDSGSGAVPAAGGRRLRQYDKA